MKKEEMLMLRLEGRTYHYIADQAGVSRQYVQEVLSPPKAIRDFVVVKYNGYCAKCGLYVGRSGHIHHENSDSEIYNSERNLVLLCISCHRKRHNIPTQFRCLYCGKPNERKKGVFCNQDCEHQYRSSVLTCPSCSNEFTLKTSQAEVRKRRNKNGLVFCSKECWDEYQKGKLWRKQNN